MGVIGRLFVALLVGNEGEHRREVQDRLGQEDAEEQADLHGAQADPLGWQQGQPVLQCREWVGRILAEACSECCPFRLGPRAGPPLSG